MRSALFWVHFSTVPGIKNWIENWLRLSILATLVLKQISFWNFFLLAAKLAFIAYKRCNSSTCAILCLFVFTWLLCWLSDSTIYLHRDDKLMPRNQAAWCAWNFLGDPNGQVCVTYWLNTLQVSTFYQIESRLTHNVLERTIKDHLRSCSNVSKCVYHKLDVTWQLLEQMILKPNEDSESTCFSLLFFQNLGDTGKPYLVTLNPPEEPSDIVNVWRNSHPIPSPGAAKATKDFGTIQGKRGVWFCGAYLGYGFHEDGLKVNHPILLCWLRVILLLPYFLDRLESDLCVECFEF